MASSQNVAAMFSKEHKDVLESIRALIASEPELGRRNFPLSSYRNAQNKEQPCYIMDRDGFTLLAMGFTGPKALQFKLAYIKAFNEMEAALRGPAQAPAVNLSR